MKKNLKKILILLILFVLAAAGYFTWSWMQLREDGAVYTSIEDANLPVAYVNILGRRMNELDGFVEDSQKAAGRGDLTLLPADRKLSVTIDKLDSQITGMQYEIRSLDGERLVERTTLDHWEQSGEEVSAELPIQNLLTEESEYRLTIAIATEKHPAIYFYTRVMWQQESRVQEMVDLAVSFSEKTFDYDSARELTTYLETDPNADNSSLGHVTLKSDFSQLTWKGLSMERVSEPEIHLRELQGIIGTIDLKYVVSEMKDGKAAAYYDVIESFTMKLGAQRIYMMNYDRRADQIFTGESSAYSGDRIQLGVSDAEDLQSMQDEAGKYRAFVANRALWIYDTGKKESTKVYTALKKNDLLGARYAVSMIVGRDTNVLDEAGVARAAVETVAESTSDGVIAPMLYTALGGPVLGMIYKAVNTMDSMVGYKSSRYLYFGRAAAKLDDVINWIPARISALLLIAGSAFLSVTRIFSKEKAVYNTKDAWHIWRRDAKKHASPNAGHTEAACAGALGIRLAGDTIYGSKVIKKPYIGDDKRAVLPEDICRCNYLMYAAAVLGEVICVILMILLNFIG